MTRKQRNRYKNNKYYRNKEKSNINNNVKSTSIVKYNDFDKKYLILNNNLKSLIEIIYKKYENPIAYKILYDTKNQTYNNNRVNWLNLTVDKSYLSYSTPDKIKSDKDEWRKSNRQPIQIRKLIRKMYKRLFSNREIKSFVGKFTVEYVKYIDKKKNQKKVSNADILDYRIDNIVQNTIDNKLKWKFVSGNKSLLKYISKLKISETKYLYLEYFYNIYNDNDHYLVVYIINNDNKIYIFNSNVKHSSFIGTMKFYIDK